MNRAIKMVELTAALPYDFTRLPFVALIGYIAFNQTPDSWTWAGAGVIFASTLYITHREAIMAPQDKTQSFALSDPNKPI
jgi:drug/metabolite transporter (DMT)-like permease